MSVLTHTQEVFAARVAAKTGLDRNVVRGWVLQEESGSAAHARDASGNMNWLNYSAGTGPGGRFDHPEWNGDPVKAADAIAHVINTSSYYKGIAASAGGHPADQIEAIAASPWDVAHYAGGSHLVSTYHLVSGLPAPKITDTTPTAPTIPSTPSLPKAPKMPETIDQAPQIGSAEQSSPFLVGHTIALPNMDGSLPAPAASPFSKLKIPPPPPVPDPVPAVDAAVSTLKQPSSTVAHTILATAETQVGAPYVWGGTSPKGFDCSGLVYWAAKQHGVTLPRTSQEQSTVGTAVKSILLLQPGDLLFFGQDHHHEAIYAGNGQMLEAPHHGAQVRKVPLRTADLTAMRRLKAK